MTLLFPPKDPEEILDYKVVWTGRLNAIGDADTLATSAFTVVEGGAAIQSDTHDTASATVWVTGGQMGEICRLLNRVTTTAGRRFDQTIAFKITER